jgi:hypothetical protein
MHDQVLELPLAYGDRPKQDRKSSPALDDELAAFRDFGQPTRALVTSVENCAGHPLAVPTYVNEFWTSKQRAASSLQEVSYRACFKPQLPRFFISRLTTPGEIVYDPFMGRGTTLLEAALMDRIPCGCDLNPLSAHMIRPRLAPPSLADVESRLAEIDFQDPEETPEDLLVFYHPETLRQISSLRRYLRVRTETGALDAVDDWIRLVALNRLTGHSPGFFSVYTMPPNQAVSVASQRKINERRRQTPPPRNVPAIILKKSRNLLADCSDETRRRMRSLAGKSMLLTSSAAATPSLRKNSIALIVTSPPFLDVVDYALDNWLRCWFIGLEASTVPFSVPRNLKKWGSIMQEIFLELHRVLKPGGHVAFEVGEVRGGKVKLEETVIPAGLSVGLQPELVLINDQKFTKTANCWGVDNNAKGTNTNRVVLFRKP